MKNVLVYGDSISWGKRPGRGDRYTRMDRWPTILQHELGRDYHVICEALCGRTTVYDTPGSPDRNGETFLPMLLETHSPLDIVVLMLGANDLQYHRHLEPRDAARGCMRLISIIQGSNAGPGGRSPEVILLAPPFIRQPMGDATLYFNPEPTGTDGFGESYRIVAETMGCTFLDTSKVVEPSPLDGVHLDPKANVALGEAVVPLIQKYAEA